MYTSHRATTRYHHYLLAREITEGYVMYSITRKQREVTGLELAKAAGRQKLKRLKTIESDYFLTKISK